MAAIDLYAFALDIVERAGLLKGFMGYPQPVPFIGHGIGLPIRLDMLIYLKCKK